jgi:hypothetical protein
MLPLSRARTSAALAGVAHEPDRLREPTVELLFDHI